MNPSFRATRLLLAVAPILACLAGCAGCSDKKQPPVGCAATGCPDAGTPDAGTPDAGTPDAGTPDAGTSDAGTPDAGTSDAGTPDASVTLLEDFHDATALDPSQSAAVVDPSGSGYLVAPGTVFAGSDCSEGVLSALADGGLAITLDAGVHQFAAIDLPRGAAVTSDGGLDVRVCGAVSLADSASIAPAGPLTLTAWGSATLVGNSSLQGGGTVSVFLPDAGSTLTVGGDIFSNVSTPLDTGAVTIGVNGDLSFPANGRRAIYDTGILDGGTPGPVRVVVAGSLAMLGGAIFADISTDPLLPTAPLFVRVGGDLSLANSSALFTNVSTADPRTVGGNVDVVVGGSVLAQNAASAIFIDGPGDTLRLRARKDARLPAFFIDTDDTAGLDGGVVVDVQANGTLTCTGLLGAGQAGLPRSDGARAGTLTARAQALRLESGCVVQTGSAGRGSPPGALVLTAADGGISVVANAFVQPGPNVCGPGTSTLLSTSGSVLIATDGGTLTFDGGRTDGVVGGDSISPPAPAAPCTPAAGGDLRITAGGDIAVSGGIAQAGGGSTAGQTVLSPHTAVDAGLAPIPLAETFQAVSRVYDLKAPLRVAKAPVVTLRAAPPAEGTALVELSMADSAAGPFGAWARADDPAALAALGAHRYLRWRASVDRFFLSSWAIDRLQIDLAP